MYKLVFFVPEAQKEQVKLAVFSAGAGKIGHYDQCCWEVKGTGQFRPLSGSTPAIGSRNVVEQVEEFRVELVCEDHLIEKAVEAMKQAHPYEEPAYDICLLEKF